MDQKLHYYSICSFIEAISKVPKFDLGVAQYLVFYKFINVYDCYLVGIEIH